MTLKKRLIGEEQASNWRYLDYVLADYLAKGALSAELVTELFTEAFMAYAVHDPLKPGYGDAKKTFAIFLQFIDKQPRFREAIVEKIPEKLQALEHIEVGGVSGVLRLLLLAILRDQLGVSLAELKVDESPGLSEGLTKITTANQPAVENAKKLVEECAKLVGSLIERFYQKDLPEEEVCKAETEIRLLMAGFRKDLLLARGILEHFASRIHDSDASHIDSTASREMQIAFIDCLGRMGKITVGGLGIHPSRYQEQLGLTDEEVAEVVKYHKRCDYDHSGPQDPELSAIGLKGEARFDQVTSKRKCLTMGIGEFPARGASIDDLNKMYEKYVSSVPVKRGTGRKRVKFDKIYRQKFFKTMPTKTIKSLNPESEKTYPKKGARKKLF